MFDGLDAALARLLDLAGAPSDVRAADVSFETPGRDYRPSLPTVNLFLYEASEDLDLRDVEPIRKDIGTRVVLEQPAMRAECRYLMTTWAPADTQPAARAAAEHRLLGLTLGWLARFPTLPGQVLGPELASQPYPIPMHVGRHVQPRETIELWNALGATPRSGTWVSATVALETALAVADAPRVDVVELSTPESTFAFGGRVVDAHSSTPIVGAQVALEPIGRTTTTDATGRFQFASVPTGTYDLVVDAGAHQPDRRTVAVPSSAAGEYDTELTPVS